MTRWRRADDLAFVESGQRVVILRLSEPAGDPLALEGTAHIIWTHVPPAEEAAREDVEIVASIAHAEGMDAELIADDTLSFLADLANLGLIREG